MNISNNVLVSVIVTSYKRESLYLKRSLMSVINQTYKNIEIILVDDNGDNNKSYSDSLDQLVEANFPMVKILRHTKNMGAQVSRNDGIRAAQGAVIAFLDDDDEWLPSKIEKQLSIFDSDAIGLVYTKGYSITEESLQKCTYYTSLKFAKEYTFLDLLITDRIGTTTQALVPKKVFEDIGYFDIEQPARQDYEMWLRISQKYRCVGVDDFLFNHYMHKGEQISKNGNKTIIGYERIVNKYGTEYKKYPVALFNKYVAIYGAYRRMGDKVNTVKYAFKAIILIPSILTKNFKDIRVIKENLNFFHKGGFENAVK